MSKTKISEKNTIEEKSLQISNEDVGVISVEQKLTALYRLQLIDSKIDKIRIVRGELPLEVQDLEDEIEGLEKRIEKYENEIVDFKNLIEEKKVSIKECNSLIKKYESQQMNVRNNREYESISKELEFQKLEIELCEKRIYEYTEGIKTHTQEIEKAKVHLDDKKSELDEKQNELEEIVKDTEKEEQELIRLSKENESIIEDRLLIAYKRIRKNARNGLAVVQVERDACGGCFNKIPPQRQLDIRMHKKIIVCEYCGRVLIDDNIAERAKEMQ